MAAVLSYGRLAAAQIPGYHSTKSRYRDKTALQHSTLYPAAMYFVNCTLYTVHCTLYTVYCTLYNVLPSGMEKTRAKSPAAKRTVGIGEEEAEGREIRAVVGLGSV